MAFSNIEENFLSELQQKMEADYNDFRQYQAETIRTFSQFHQICTKHGIPYYLAYGSLLGAIRDGGQIPWDYDIDLWVPYEYAQKLVDALVQDLPQEYYFVTRVHDPAARHHIMRVTPVGYDSEVLHVDVFWLTGLPVDSKAREVIHQKMLRSTKAMRIKHCAKELQGVSGKVSHIKYYLERILYAFYPDKATDKLFHRVMHDCRGHENLTDNFYAMELKAEWFGEPKTITLASGQEACVPRDHDAILSWCYKDHRSYPSIESRAREFQTALTRLRKFAKK